MIDRLGAVLKANGFLSTARIEERQSLPSIPTIVDHFATPRGPTGLSAGISAKAEMFALRSARNREKRGRERNVRGPTSSISRAGHDAKAWAGS